MARPSRTARPPRQLGAASPGAVLTLQVVGAAVALVLAQASTAHTVDVVADAGRQLNHAVIVARLVVPMLAALAYSVYVLSKVWHFTPDLAERTTPS